MTPCRKAFEELPVTENTPWYDDLEPMLDKCQTLEGLHEVLDARRAARGREECMHTFVVNGTWHLDTFGQCGRMSVPRLFVEKAGDVECHYKFLDIDFLKLPTVLTIEQYRDLLPKDAQWSFGFGGNNSYPPDDHLVCPCCRKGWTINNSGDFRTSRPDGPVIRLDDPTAFGGSFLGKTLREVREAYRQRADAVWYLSREYPVRNDKWIDTTQRPDYETLLMNERGWAVAGQERLGYTTIDADNYVVQAGDEAGFDIVEYTHVECHARRLAEDVSEELGDAIAAAGIIVFGAIRLPNEYGSLEYRGPWFMFDTDKGYVKLGWRKRVIDLKYIGDIADPKAVGSLGHFYSYEDLTAYLTTHFNPETGDEKATA